MLFKLSLLISLVVSQKLIEPLLPSEAPAAHSKIWVDAEHTALRDPSGRHRIFHGVNVVYKVPPYIPGQGDFDSQSSLNDEDIANLKKWGLNFVRLGVMWEGIERQPGQYNASYLTEIDQLITKLGEAGIYTLVDAHQDVLARTICGEGMPNFYAKEIIEGGTHCLSEALDPYVVPIAKALGGCKSMEDYGMRKDSDGNPLIEDCQKYNFGVFYASPESITLFDALYKNKNGTQDKFIASWDHATRALAHNPYNLGYDPINEPAPGWDGLIDFLSVFVLKGMDEHKLAPMYEKIFANIMKVDEEGVLWFEPPQVPDTVWGWVRSVAFTTPPGGRVGSQHHVLNDHTYCCNLRGVCPDHEPKAGTEAKCRNFHEKKLGQRAKDAKALGVPLFITEFGACLDSDRCATEIT